MSLWCVTDGCYSDGTWTYSDSPDSGPWCGWHKPDDADLDLRAAPQWETEVRWVVECPIDGGGWDSVVLLTEEDARAQYAESSDDGTGIPVRLVREVVTREVIEEVGGDE